MSPVAPLTTVFVYGTLMPGERNAHVADRGDSGGGSVGSPAFQARPATLPGFELFDLRPEGYPGIRQSSPEHVVHGYALTYTPAAWAEALPFLDDLEGVDEVPPLYTREQVTLRGADGQAFPAWVYVYALTDRLEQPGVRVIQGGDWREVADRTQRGPDER